MEGILRILLVVFIAVNGAYAAVVHNGVWENGNTLFGFFQKYKIPASVYFELSPEDRELTGEIYTGVRYFVALDEKDNLLQALIPIGDGMQIHIFRYKDSYKIDFRPIAYFESRQQIVLAIQKSAYQDLMELTDDKGLVNEFLSAYKNSVNFSRNVIKGDKLALIYDRKYRLGIPLGNPRIQAAMIETNRKPNYIFSFNNGRYYDGSGKEIEGFLLYAPIRFARISSRFSLGRKHPILGFVRPHYGVDYAAPKGTKVVSAGNGVVSFVGKKGGYGNVIEIRHENGLKTIYAHLDSFAPGMQSGRPVKRGQYIAKVGSTGLSTGPHLHFGVYKNNRPINPLGNIKTDRKELRDKEKREFLASANTYKSELDFLIAEAQLTEDRQAIVVRLNQECLECSAIPLR
ncbi:peptidoglycan DD-metalloendopeptidase family protein [Helicobacter sp. 10-6591]|uniref:peptidoglycan DD-metalloendopeptidase family protein n=1 Tax=Helicobacter sp. 10-6591 TaxID=2004998 RepID=UPI000DCD328A|nr:peptidoglycan DD-metalloendopeptidase family protein [Helicobacter sp. 10-6591]RAX56128.1 endopeptidase [Helicobacter sp. 10-6591]